MCVVDILPVTHCEQLTVRNDDKYNQVKNSDEICIARINAGHCTASLCCCTGTTRLGNAEHNNPAC